MPRTRNKRSNVLIRNYSVPYFNVMPNVVSDAENKESAIECIGDQRSSLFPKQCFVDSQQTTLDAELCRIIHRREVTDDFTKTAAAMLLCHVLFTGATALYVTMLRSETRTRPLHTRPCVWLVTFPSVIWGVFGDTFTDARMISQLQRSAILPRFVTGSRHNNGLHVLYRRNTVVQSNGLIAASNPIATIDREL